MVGIKEKWRKLDESMMKSRGDVPYLYRAPDSPLKCSECGYHLGLWRLVRKAFFKKKGDKYHVKCKKCGAVNTYTKGEIGKELDKRWEEE